ncbi:MAG: hypothetical protein IBX67_01570 [Dehalococcoidia bacterium]|nr:hypothetical protein [Dehalococcoidia bacterium]
MMTCAGLLAVAAVILLVGSLLILALIPLAMAVLLLCLLLILATVIFMWRHIYPWLVRMGRWAARPLNIIFLLVVIVVVELLLRYGLGMAGVSLPSYTLPVVGETTIIGIGLGLLWLFLLLLAIVVWLVRLWRYGWPRVRNVFWDLCFRVVALGWRILVGIPLGVVWFFYHPPVRWLLAVLLFYLRGVSAAVAWFLYHPPLRELIRAGLFITRLVVAPLAWLIYEPPIRWAIAAALFFITLMAHFVSTAIERVWATEFVKGVRKILRRGLTVERESYQDYKYAHDDSRAAA